MDKLDTYKTSYKEVASIICAVDLMAFLCHAAPVAIGGLDPSPKSRAPNCEKNSSFNPNTDKTAWCSDGI